MRGHVHDIVQFKAWTEAALEGGFLTIYRGSSANYPPLAPLPLVAMGWLGRLFSPGLDLASDTFTALIKLPAITADLLATGVVYNLVRSRHGKRPALVSAAAYAFNPAIWYTSAWWGQLEALYALPMLLSLSAASRVRQGRAGAWLAAGVLVKPHAAVIAPLLALVNWRQGGWRALARSGLAAALVVVLVLAPLAWAGELPALWAGLRASAGRQLFLTMNAHNIWYLLTLGRGSFAARGGDPLYDTALLLGPLTGWHLGLLLLGAWSLYVLWALWRCERPEAPGTLFLAGSALVAGFYMLPAEVHERYLFPALTLLAPLLPERRAARWLYLGFSLTLFLNLLWVDPAVPLPNYAEQLPWGLPIALANTLLLGLFTRASRPPILSRG
jgi:Gpi18-like mannosyltransferase